MSKEQAGTSSFVSADAETNKKGPILMLEYLLRNVSVDMGHSYSRRAQSTFKKDVWKQYAQGTDIEYLRRLAKSLGECRIINYETLEEMERHGF